ncbi:MULTISPECIES: CHAT domain-containing protein [unclassified Microcoleus]|nr:MULTISPECIES: CHAT domain-containing tetratricopeptide repeat protein [unclassified Microcoleus]
MLLDEGLKLFYQRKFNEAISKLEAALTIYRATGSRLQEASCLFHIGFAKQGLRDFAGAIKSLQPTLLFWQETRNFTLKAMTLTLIGLAYEGQGNLEEAVNVYKQAVDVNEKIVGGIKVQEHQRSFARMQGLMSERLSILLSLAGRYEESFNYVERAKARAFLDQYVRGSIDFRKNGDAELLANGDGLEQEIATVRNRLINAQNNQELNNIRETLDPQLESLEKQYEDWYLELKNRSPETASLKRVEVASLGEIQKAIAQIDSDTTLVEYFVTNGGTLVFIITANSLKMLRLPASRKDLRAAIDRWSEGDATNRDNNPHPASLQELYKELIAPIKPYITTSTIGIIPHDLLNSVPFPGLTDGKRNLIDDYAMFVLPNASILPFLRGKRKPSAGTILALGMGNPQLSTPPSEVSLLVLTGVGEEVRAIKEIYPKTQVLVEQVATETAVVSQAGKYEILHIAAHAVYNKNNPLSSTIYLAKDNQNDGNLQVRDLYGLNLTAATNLVVLTGCEGQRGNVNYGDEITSQRGDVNYGDEITSLSRGFMYAGTPSIIANLWKTSDDESTKILMQRFYTYLPKMGKAKALRQAQIDVRNHNSKYSHPFYWGGFMLTGDWGKL